MLTRVVLRSGMLVCDGGQWSQLGQESWCWHSSCSVLENTSYVPRVVPVPVAIPVIELSSTSLLV